MRTLPININPIAKTYNSTAFPLSILFAENDKLICFFLNTHIQVYRDKNFPDYNFYNYFSPYYEWECFDYQIIRKYYCESSHIVLQKLIKTSIDNSNYVITYWDEYYIKQRNAYNNYHFIHDVLLFGYNEKFYHVLGYDDNGKYTSSLIDKEVFCSSVLSDPRIKDYNFCEISQFIILIKRKIDFTEEISLITIYRLMKEYLSSKSILVRYVSSKNYIFGIDAFKYLAKDILDDTYYDIRSFCLFKEHKHVMKYRFDYLLKEGLCDKNICDEYKNIESEANIIFNLYLKYNLTQSKKLVLRISDRIFSLLDREKYILEEYLKDFHLVN